ncbi:enoyl-CoA hydratase/isomerase family protein [Streptomyces sp. NBC_00338]|uniref:enoyl-CoA hydratase/isomerase family protein n=1 Tax=unclassified Streptomyces TaxID=2593676 RepID=UPI002257F23A|nr:enoyl-CoA hydratase-related protein [Streptomyces sp. NBC_00338]MCX5144152.1 enoyl-CoA hydratase-related protein [Streptomyces sp. NBC_00338]WSU62487.1 enoyl-CoA hydratase-related protein [Streptomyces sp. NBC_01104]
MADLEYTVRDGIATILLNRPERKNAFTIDMVHAWADALTEAQGDPEVRVIVVTGAGDSFCSGVDLAAFKGEERAPLGEKELLTQNVHRVALALEDIDKPVIAAVTGPAVGAGMDMALLCDLRFAGRGARFSEGYIKVGLVPGDGGCWLLPRAVGTSTALRMLWTGDFVGAEEALRIGLVDEVHEDADLMGAVYAYAARLAERPPVAIRTIKRAVRQGARHDLRTALDLISSHMAVITSTQDSQEAFAAFQEKRPGVFTGR